MLIGRVCCAYHELGTRDLSTPDRAYNCALALKLARHIHLPVTLRPTLRPGTMGAAFASLVAALSFRVQFLFLQIGGCS